MNINPQSLIEFIVGLIGIISAAAGFSAWVTSTQIKHDIANTINSLKQDSVTLRRRVKLLELFATKGGFLRETGIAGEDTDL